MSFANLNMRLWSRPDVQLEVEVGSQSSASFTISFVGQIVLKAEYSPGRACVHKCFYWCPNVSGQSGG